MRNLFGKSVKLIAGISLLFLYNCTTLIPSGDGVERASSSLDSIFSENMKTLLYFNSQENITLIESISHFMDLDERTISIVNKSRDVYIAFPGDISGGMNVVVTGDFSKWKAELGLFFSFDWKKIKGDGYKIWINEDGLSLYFIGDEIIIISSFNIEPIITILEENYLDPPTDSILLVLPNMDEEQNKNLSNGFIKGGINNMSVSLNLEDSQYRINCILGLDSVGKARALSRLVKIFLKISLSVSTNADIVKIADEFEIKSENSTVLVENISLSEKIIVDFINNIIFLDREADK